VTTICTKNDGSVSIRSYTLSQNSHAHEFHQIVVPLSGALDISFGIQRYSVAVGHCIVIPSGTEHRYSAPDRSRFFVADMGSLPKNAAKLNEPCVAISADLMTFCSYADVQLTKAADRDINVLLYSLFWRLIEQQDFARRIDDRIMRAILLMEEDLAVSHSIEALAEAAFLSASQFKTLFKKKLGVTCHTFLTQRRMERARTLLMNTDYPVSVVAVDVGYEDASAFARRFKAHFEQSPRDFARGG
jgi:AraC-like DNA-binding protein